MAIAGRTLIRVQTGRVAGFRMWKGPYKRPWAATDEKAYGGPYREREGRPGDGASFRAEMTP